MTEVGGGGAELKHKCSRGCGGGKTSAGDYIWVAAHTKTVGEVRPEPPPPSAHLFTDDPLSHARRLCQHPPGCCLGLPIVAVSDRFAASNGKPCG